MSEPTHRSCPAVTCLRPSLCLNMGDQGFQNLHTPFRLTSSPPEVCFGPKKYVSVMGDFLCHADNLNGEYVNTITKRCLIEFGQIEKECPKNLSPSG